MVISWGIVLRFVRTIYGSSVEESTRHTMLTCSANGESDTSMKKKELSCFHFPLEKPKIVRQRIHNGARPSVIFLGEMSSPRL